MGDLDKDRNLNVKTAKKGIQRKGLSCKSWPSATTI